VKEKSLSTTSRRVRTSKNLIDIVVLF
jgi:hypothetical protein